MKIKLTLTPQSPMMIGGKTQNNNYRASREYIPGSVLRAAYARAILDRCPYDDDVTIDGEVKRYWVSYRDRTDCQACPLTGVCRNFDTLRFPTLYPAGATVYPMTARRCKYPQATCKPQTDILRTLLLSESIAPCGCASSLERLQGMHLNGEKVRIVKQLLTKSAISPVTNAVRTGTLYSMEVLSEQTMQGDTLIETSFSGTLETNETGGADSLESIPALRVGAGTTKGLGHCKVSYCQEAAAGHELEQRLQAFHEGMPKGKQFLVIDLLTDAYLSLEAADAQDRAPSTWSDIQYAEFLKTRILPESIRDANTLELALKTQEVIRGFDTSQDDTHIRLRNPRILVHAGAVFVFSQDKNKPFDLPLLHDMEEKGIGEHTEHGFGKIRICDTFHTQYCALKEGRGE